MVGPKQKKEAVKHVLAQGSCSLRRACQYFGLHRSTYLYEPKKVMCTGKSGHEILLHEILLNGESKHGKKTL